MSAEAIASVVSDLRSGRYRVILDDLDDGSARGYVEHHAAVAGPVVDATAIYKSLAEMPRAVRLYEDHPCIAPPWPNAAICYQNDHGNVMVMTLRGHDYKEERETAKAIPLLQQRRDDGPQEGPWVPSEPINWDDVRWIIATYVWIGGRSYEGNLRIRTGGPLWMWTFAVYEDGQPADLHWIQLTDTPVEHWEMASLVLLGSLNFMNCRNVELVEPQLPRSEARRVARTGVQIQTINVFPTGRSARAAKASGQTGVPLTSVRGHFARYGPEYGRGLLFGKYSGRFWIPQHARGERELGEHQSDYVLHPERDQ